MAAWSRAGQIIDQALDSVFDEPYDVPDTATALSMVAEQDSRKLPLVPEFFVSAIALRLARWVPRMSRVGGVTTAVTVTSANRARQAVQRGLMELRVLASLLAQRARDAGTAVDKGFIRAATVEIYLDPRRRIDFRYRGPRAGRVLAARWIRDAVANPDGIHRAKERIEAIERLDLQSLVNRWSADGLSR
jgi:hypothetical protein